LLAAVLALVALVVVLGKSLWALAAVLFALALVLCAASLLFHGGPPDGGPADHDQEAVVDQPMVIEGKPEPRALPTRDAQQVHTNPAASVIPHRRTPTTRPPGSGSAARQGRRRGPRRRKQGGQPETPSQN
jgi:hypothetical protein